MLGTCRSDIPLPDNLRRLTRTQGISFLIASDFQSRLAVRPLSTLAKQYLLIYRMNQAAFVIPDIQTRAASDLSDLGGENIAFSTFFDVDHLMHSLKRDCPQMKVIQRQDLPPDKPYVLNPFTVSPQILVDDIFDHTLMVDPKQWRPSFDNWLGRKLGKHLATSKSSSSEPIFVVAVSPLFNWPADYDGEAFKRNFGKVLRFPHEIRVLAAKTLYAVSHEFKIQLQSTGITPNAFFAAHLRTEADATKSGYTSYDVQASSYLKQAEAKNLTKIYAASGSLEELQRFTNDAIDRGMVVTTKFELLTEDNLDQLEALRWDQQALIDFEVLLRASSFAGIEASSFAFNIALLRHELSDMDGFLQGWGGQNFEDEYSCLYGLPARIPRLQQGVYP